MVVAGSCGGLFVGVIHQNIGQEQMPKSPCIGRLGRPRYLSPP